MYKLRPRKVIEAVSAMPVDSTATKSKAKRGPKPKPKAIQREAKIKRENVGHKSRRDSDRGRSNHRSVSPCNFNHRDANLAYGYGNGYNWYPPIQPTPYGYYPQFNPMGFGMPHQAMVPPQQHAMGGSRSKAKRKRSPPPYNDMIDSSDDSTISDSDLPVAVPAKRNYRSKSVSFATVKGDSTAKPRGRPKTVAVTPNASTMFGDSVHTMLSGDLPSIKAPAKRMNRALSVANRIQTVDSVGKQDLPWQQTIPRFSVLDSQHSRPVPNLNPIVPSAAIGQTTNESPKDSVQSGDTNTSDELLDIQLKMNRDIMKRVEKLEAENKAKNEEFKALQADLDLSRKQNQVIESQLAASLAECAKLKEKLATFKPVSKPFKPVVLDANKENVVDKK